MQTSMDSDRANRAVLQTSPLAEGLRSTVDCERRLVGREGVPAPCDGGKFRKVLSNHHSPVWRNAPRRDCLLVALIRLRVG